MVRVWASSALTNKVLHPPLPTVKWLFFDDEPRLWEKLLLETIALRWKQKKKQGPHFPSVTTTTGGDSGLSDEAASKWYPDGSCSCSLYQPHLGSSIFRTHPWLRRSEKLSWQSHQRISSAFCILLFASCSSGFRLLVLTFMLRLWWYRTTACEPGWVMVPGPSGIHNA